jgi:hypothetical protein
LKESLFEKYKSCLYLPPDKYGDQAGVMELAGMLDLGSGASKGK